MRPIPITRHRRNQTTTEVDATGGVFVPDRERGLVAPIYTYGPPDVKERRPVFTCPVSAMPQAAWTLIDLWWACRTMRALPLAGGWLDQPLMVRRAFPILEAEYAPVEARQRTAAMGGMFAGTLAQAFGGGR